MTHGTNGARIKGQVTRLIPDKGFGFIRAEHTRVEYFFHRTACQAGVFETLRDGDPVLFTASEGPKGLRAEAVEVLE